MAKAKAKKNWIWKAGIGVLIAVLVAMLAWTGWEWWIDRKAGFLRYDAFGIDIPNRFSIHGIDVSKYQSRINWESVTRMEVEGIKIGFAFIKATEGLGNKDSQFDRNWKKARESGLPRGAYHFFIATKSGKMQAQHFIEQVDLEPGDLPPVLDVEQSYGVPAEKLRERVREFLETLEYHYGVTPVIYTNVDFYRQYLDEAFDNYPLWVAHYLQKDRPRIHRQWTFWQHSETGRVNGILSRVDFNVFNGDSTDFKKLLIP